MDAFSGSQMNAHTHSLLVGTRAALQSANKNLMDCMTEIYEPEWPGHDQIPVKAQAMDIYWDELCHKLNDQVTIPLSTYLSQFSEIRVSESL